MTGRTAFCVVALLEDGEGQEAIEFQSVEYSLETNQEETRNYHYYLSVCCDSFIFLCSIFFFGGVGGGWLFFPFSFFQVGLTEEFQHKINVPLKLNGQEGS